MAITAGEGETIRYTTDCTTPNASSEVYSGELSISKNSVIRAAAFRDGYLSGDVATATYLFRSDGVNHALPVVTLVTDPDNLWNSKTGIYATGDQFDPDAASYADTLKSATYYQAKFATEEQVDTIWEKPAAFSLFDDNGKQVFTQNVGIRIAGSFGRGRAQKGFNVIARKEYGKGSMEYPFFENRPYTEYKAVVLRAGAQDQNRSKIRDELASGLLEGTDINILYQAYRPTVLYLNGEYWGVYFMKEKRNRFFVAQHENTENNVDYGHRQGLQAAHLRRQLGLGEPVRVRHQPRPFRKRRLQLRRGAHGRGQLPGLHDSRDIQRQHGHLQFPVLPPQGRQVEVHILRLLLGLPEPKPRDAGLPHGQDAQRRMLRKAVCRHAPEQGLEGQLLPPLRGASRIPPSPRSG